MRLEQIRAQGEHPPRGGAAQPVAGEQRTMLVVSGNNAWAEGGNNANPQNNVAADRRRMLWATPHGVIKAAMANNGTLEGNTIKFTADGREYTATVDAQNRIEKVSYQNYNSVVGDYPRRGHLLRLRRFWRRHVPAATSSRRRTAIPPSTSTSPQVTANPTVELAVPENVASATPPAGPPMVQMEELAPGVLYVNAAGIRSWAVEFRDHIVVVEGPNNEARSLAVNAGDQRTIPEQADPLRRQHARPLRPRGRLPHLCGAGRNRRDA